MAYDITGATLKMLREISGLTQGDAAKMVRLGSKVRWMEYELGLKRPDHARVELFVIKVAVLHGINPVDVLMDDDGIERVAIALLKMAYMETSRDSVLVLSREKNMNTFDDFKAAIAAAPEELLQLAAQDQKNESGVALNKHNEVVQFATELTQQIARSKLLPEQKDQLIAELNHKFYPDEFPADGSLNIKTGLGQLFSEALK